MLRARIDRTLEKVRQGGLPAAADATPPVIETGNGNLCSGRGETIEPADELYVVRVVVRFRFHDVCYNAWATFKRRR